MQTNDELLSYYFTDVVDCPFLSSKKPVIMPKISTSTSLGAKSKDSLLLMTPHDHASRISSARSPRSSCSSRSTLQSFYHSRTGSVAILPQYLESDHSILLDLCPGSVIGKASVSLAVASRSLTIGEDCLIIIDNGTLQIYSMTKNIKELIKSPPILSIKVSPTCRISRAVHSMGLCIFDFLVDERTGLEEPLYLEILVSCKEARERFVLALLTARY